ncbi:CASTOR/POLLUX-related putative ion channel [Rhizobium sp. LjRoot254]|uniref:CASTOR/POLLUX-related putative ion channel n=1 Tax=Rhizobium sp. LjRoot254 TaxID=3342297 RepID=UPI003ECF6101
MKQKIKLSSKLRYWFDKTMAAGTGALIGWLGIISLAIILAFGALIAITGIAQEGGENLNFAEAAWETLMRTLDAGTMGGDTGWIFRGVMLLVTLAGIFVVSTLIGVLSSGIESKLDQLRKGRSEVLEKDHTIIFNWSPSIFDVISELVIANESRRRPRIVVMSDKGKVEMEEEIAAKVPDLKNTKVICRHGDPTDLYDLAIVNPNASRSIVILSPEAADPDSSVVKTILALTQNPSRRDGKYRIAAEIRDPANAELAEIVGGGEAQLVLADDLISRIVVHSSRQPGLSAVYTELLDFDGSEIYTTEEPKLEGKSIAEAAMSYETSTVIGIVSIEGQVDLNPDKAHRIEKGERLILVAEDDDAITYKPFTGSIDRSLIRKAGEPRIAPERTLLLGWNRRAPMIASELSRFVAPGSVLTIVADTPDLQAKARHIALNGTNLTLDIREGDSSSRAELREIDPISYDHVLVLGYNEDLDPQPADTRTLVTLLHLRQIAESAGKHSSVVSEMIDIRNRELAEVSKADDFVVSNKLVSLMLAQAAENEYITRIFGCLLDEDGSELYLKPATDYVEAGVEVDFYTVTIAAMLQGQTAIGYRRRNGAGTWSVRINPSKSAKITFAEGEQVVVLSPN